MKNPEEQLERAKTPLEKIAEKLEQARDRAGSYGRKYGNFAAADDVLKGVYAQLEDIVPESKKTIPEKDAWIRRQTVYKEAVEAKRDAAADWKTADIWMKLIIEECGALRSQEATNRWVDKGHT